MRVSILILFTVIAALVAAEPKPIKDKSLNWEILAKGANADSIKNQQDALLAKAEALEPAKVKAQADLQEVIKRACESEKIQFEKCIPKVKGDQVTVEQREDPPPPKTPDKTDKKPDPPKK